MTKRMYIKTLLIMVNAQGWLDKNYPDKNLIKNYQ